MSLSFFQDLVRAAAGDEAARRRLSAEQLARGPQFLAAQCLVEHLRERDPDATVLVVRDPESGQMVRVERLDVVGTDDARPLKVSAGTLNILDGMLRAVRMGNNGHVGRLTSALIAQLDVDNPALVMFDEPVSTLDEADLAVAHV